MTVEMYWTGWMLVAALATLIGYVVIRTAVRHALKDHDKDAGIVRR
jgi:hypothetical protein